MNQISMQVVMLLFDLQELYLTSAIINFTLITGSIVFHYKFSCKKRGILLLGTIRSSRLRQCQLPSEKKNQKGRTWSFLEKVAAIDGITLSIVSCYDSNIVTLLPIFVGSEPVIEVKRFSKAKKETIKIKCPSLVQEYNRHMDCVDLLDSLLGYYR